MRVVYDKKKSEDLAQRILDKFGHEARKTSRGQEMHVSDLTGCQIKPFCRLTGIPRNATKTQIGVMVFGIVAENILGWTFPKDCLQYNANFPLLDKSQDIFGHIDIMEDRKFPIEVKATRKRIFKGADIPVYWAEQLMSYMAMHGQNIGWIVFYNIMSTQIIAFRMEMSNNDILDWIIVLNERAAKIRKAAIANDSSGLKVNPTQYSFCDYKQDCPRREECSDLFKQIRREKAKINKEKKKKNSPLE